MEFSRAVDTARMHRLKNPVQHYDWGSHSAIPELLGEPASPNQPYAELWMGAHASAPSTVIGSGGSESLREFIARDPRAVLGPAVAERFGNELPFLLKVLAAAEPLSIQAHPSLAQAREGFARENRAGLSIDARERCYRDANHKPELICALTPFHALNRFREPAEIADRLSALRASELADPIEALRRRPDRAGLADVFAQLWDLELRARLAVIERAVAWAGGAPSDPAAHWVAALARRHPGDIGVIAPLLLNTIELAPGEAMFLPAGELHSYLEGVGIEIMANSDNVLRGGLTTKHVAVPELLRALTFRAGPIERLRPEASPGGNRRYATSVDEFALGVIEVRPDSAWQAPRDRGIEILLCTRGSGRIDGPDAHAVTSGNSFVVPAAAPPYTVLGDLTLYCATAGIA